MPSGIRTTSLAAAAALLAACGNYSTDDIAFVEALPVREALRVALPGAAAQAACGGPLGSARPLSEARQAGVAMNTGLDQVLAIVDTLRQVEPTRRERDRRIWGPFPDQKHPGVEIRLVVARSYQVDLPTYAFSFEVRPAGSPDWIAVIDGAFVGASGRTGRGAVTLHFDRMRDAGIADPGSTPPALPVTIRYDRRTDPRVLSLVVAPGDLGFGLVDFDYAFTTWESGHARLDFALASAQGRAEEVARFTPAGAGQARVTFRPAAIPGLSYAFEVCWDASGCVSALNDPGSRSEYAASVPGCTVGSPCQVNWPGGCQPVR
jgi:hypothetical protein